MDTSIPVIREASESDWPRVWTLFQSVAASGEVFAYDESRKLGVTSSVFLILNKMIGTGSECHPWWIRSEQCLTDIHAVFSTPSGIFRATGNVGISIILWIIGGIITFSGLSVYVHPLSQLLVF